MGALKGSVSVRLAGRLIPSTFCGEAQRMEHVISNLLFRVVSSESNCALGGQAA